MRHPAANLPVSWPKTYEHTGCYGNFGQDCFESRKVEYADGVFVGFRWFDRLWGADRVVRFPSGFELSYTSFVVSDARISGGISNVQTEKVPVSAKVGNTVSEAGSEVVQIYLELPMVKELDRPVKGLVGFAKVELSVGEEKHIKVVLNRDAAAYWDEVENNWEVSKGVHRVIVATSSGPADVEVRLELHVESGFSYSA